MPFLADYLVVDMTDARGLMAGHLLAKLGADVVQVEPPEGSSARFEPPLAADRHSFYWDAYAAGKRSITLDYRSDSGRAVLLNLISRADFLIESFNPGEMAELGLPRELLQRINPRLIHVSITAFGSTGPKAGWQATDLTVWAAGGPLGLTFDDAGRPLGFSVPQAWQHASTDAAGGALIAHFDRVTSGRGRHVDISAQASATPATLSANVAPLVGHREYQMVPSAASLGKSSKTLDLSGSGARTRKSKWQVKDGLVEVHLGIGKAAGPVANRIYEWIRQQGGVPPHLDAWDWVTVPERLERGEIDVADVDEARDVLVPFLMRYTKKELLKEAIESQLPIAPVMQIEELLEDDHFMARRVFSELPDAVRPYVLPWALAMASADMMAPPRAAPALGAANDAVFESLRSPPPGRLASPGEKAAAPPLKGLFVLDLAWVVAGPAVGRVLADFGATVVRVESSARLCTARVLGPFPDGQYDIAKSGVFDDCNAGKHDIALNLATAEAREVVLALVAKADVVLESFAPGQLARWGLDYAVLSRRKPDLVMLSTSLLGAGGPASRFAGYGNAGAAFSGFTSLVGHAGRRPVGPYGPYTDFTGPKLGLVLLLAALDRRRRTAEGCWIDLSQAESGIQFLAPQVAAFSGGGVVATASGNRRSNMVPHGVFRCAGEGKWIAIAIRNDADWAAIAVLVGQEAVADELRTLDGRKAAEDRVEHMLERWTSALSIVEIEVLLQASGVPAHRVSTAEDLVGDPQLEHQGHFIHLARPDGSVSVVEASRLMLSDTPAQTVRAAPWIGQDTDMVLKEVLRYDQEEIERLRRADALR